ncbi:GNAT family N-acetyltransferase [candidate division CSSED10-310 bacterium]|uniref:GNAT family N-acetyltransferase n=1 Tax=candidate division CSSED10-310 bacterium TaxID=2855610 RepID=A0ABV6Z182_UNCC1
MLKRRKPLTAKADVSLREITEETLSQILSLKVKRNQRQFVASNAVSIAQAYFSKYAWFRAIYAHHTPVGFLMLYDDPDKPEYFLWRFMIDKKHQGKGFGNQALQLLIAYVRTRPNATTLLLSFVPGEGSPEAFYQKSGFVKTGEQIEGELVMKMTL